MEFGKTRCRLGERFSFAWPLVHFSGPQLHALSAARELFAANFRGDAISRFTFDGNATATANGIIGLNDGAYVLGLACSPAGELFVASHGSDTVLRNAVDADGIFTPFYEPGFGEISRFLFDGNGTAMPNGSVTTPSLGQPATFAGPVPEPDTLALLGLCVVGLGFTCRRGAAQAGHPQGYEAELRVGEGS